jgi:hypothetical protein
MKSFIVKVYMKGVFLKALSVWVSVLEALSVRISFLGIVSCGVKAVHFFKLVSFLGV